MKKYFLQILVLTVAIGFVSSVLQTHAQQKPLGTCTSITNIVSHNFSFDGCTAQSGKWEIYSITNPPPGSNPPANNPNKICKYDDKGIATNMPCLGTSNYKLLSPLPGVNSVPVGEDNALGNYLNVIIRLVIGLAAVMAMVMIVMGGIQYMTSELPHMKEGGKERITNAILGLLIALGAYLILFTINPDLLNTNIKIDRTEIAYTGAPESNLSFSPINPTTLQTFGIICDSTAGLHSIAKSFEGNSTYSMEKRNQADATTAYFDCSSYVSQVYACKGLSRPGNNTTEIFNRGNSIVSIEGTKINGIELQVGDLIGWKPGDNGKRYGHVLMYVGGGNVIDSRGGTSFNQAVSESSLGSWKNLTYISRIGSGAGGSF